MEIYHLARQQAIPNARKKPNDNPYAADETLA